MEAVSERRPIFPLAGEEQQVHRLSAALQQNGTSQNEDKRAKLVSPSGEELELPASVYKILVRVVRQMDQGNGITIIPVHAELTTQQAADLLNVSRPYLISLLEKEEILFHKVGRHRRIRLDDLLNYKERRDSKRRRLLRDMTREAQEAGLYGE
jgi:excisionase family DNA binding protein